jgi:hypothetical protein
MKSGPTPAFVLARVCAPAAQAWLPVCRQAAAWSPRGGGREAAGVEGQQQRARECRGGDDPAA